MKALDLSQELKKYTSGWVVFNKESKIIDHNKSLTKLLDKYQKRNDVTLMPASDNYFGYVTVHG